MSIKCWEIVNLSRTTKYKYTQSITVQSSSKSRWIISRNGLLCRNKNLSTSCVQTLFSFTDNNWGGQNGYFWKVGGGACPPVPPPLVWGRKRDSEVFHRVFNLKQVAITSRLQNLRNHAKFRENSQFHSSKVIDLGANRKRICNFFVIISNFGSISYSYRDIDT